MTHLEYNRSGAFQIEVGAMESFLEMLGSREEESAPSEYALLPRRAVFVAPLKQARLSEVIPLVTRRVRAAFAYGGDLVILTRVTANGYEFPPLGRRREKQRPPGRGPREEQARDPGGNDLPRTLATGPRRLAQARGRGRARQGRRLRSPRSRATTQTPTTGR